MDNHLPELPSYNTEALQRRNLNNSVIKTIYGFSAHLPDNSPIKLIYEFANGILWFRSLGNYEYMGKTNIIENLDQYIASDSEKMKAFEHFLSQCGLPFSLMSVSDVTGRHVYAHFVNASYPLFAIASIGTKALCLFFYWMDKMKGKISFLYLDEYDAFYHYNLAQGILKIVNEDSSYQSVITTHNLYLADNAIMVKDVALSSAARTTLLVLLSVNILAILSSFVLPVTRMFGKNGPMWALMISYIVEIGIWIAAIGLYGYTILRTYDWTFLLVCGITLLRSAQYEYFGPNEPLLR